MSNRAKRPGQRSRRILAVVLAVAAAVLCFVVDRSGGQGSVPCWEDLYQVFGLEPGTAALVEGQTSVTFLDVGQGDSVLILQDGSACLIDAGPYNARDALAETLAARGVERIDLLVMTHPHADHIGGMPSVLAQCEVKTLLLPALGDSDSDGSLVRRVLEQARAQGTELVRAEDGMELPVGNGTLTVLSAGFAPEESSSDDPENDSSLCLQFRAGTFTFLDTGDAERDAEADLLARYGSDLRSIIFKAGHHGSSTSNTEAFLRAVNPVLVTASCGQDNDYGHPHREVVERLASLDIPLYRTDRDGSVTVTVSGQELSVLTTRTGGESILPAA